MKILLLLLLTGCQATPLLEKEFNLIHSQPYKLHVWDCSNKCALYAVLLHKAGYEVVVKVYYFRGDYCHALVYANGIYHCPTTGRTFRGDWEIKKLCGGEYLWDVTIEEILNKNTREWNYVRKKTTNE